MNPKVEIEITQGVDVEETLKHLLKIIKECNLECTHIKITV